MVASERSWGFSGFGFIGVEVGWGVCGGLPLALALCLFALRGRRELWGGRGGERKAGRSREGGEPI